LKVNNVLIAISPNLIKWKIRSFVPSVDTDVNLALDDSASGVGSSVILKKRMLKDRIMDLKSLTVMVLIMAGWLILFGVILPKLGINT